MYIFTVLYTSYVCRCTRRRIHSTPIYTYMVEHKCIVYVDSAHVRSVPTERENLPHRRLWYITTPRAVLYGPCANTVDAPISNAPILTTKRVHSCATHIEQSAFYILSICHATLTRRAQAKPNGAHGRRWHGVTPTYPCVKHVHVD